MAGVIVLSAILTGSDADILQGTRLQTVPQGGSLLFLMSASDAIAANNYTVKIQLPSGDTPLDGVIVPQGQLTAGTPGILDDRLMLAFRATVAQGGHCVFGVVETGDTEFMYRVVYTPGPYAGQAGLVS